MKRSIYKLSAYFLLIPIVYGQSPYLPCSDGSPEPISYNYLNCTEYMCNVTAGTQESFTIEFLADRKIQCLKVKARYVTTKDITKVIDLPLLDEDACDALIDAKCPLKKGQKATYSASLSVPPSEREFAGFVEARIVDGNNSTVSCLIHVVLILPPIQ